ncbi:MAG: hypothetical protein ABIH83_05465 [Candidatus Micrarchaeota archaeon]
MFKYLCKKWKFLLSTVALIICISFATMPSLPENSGYCLEYYGSGILDNGEPCKPCSESYMKYYPEKAKEEKCCEYKEVACVGENERMVTQCIYRLFFTINKNEEFSEEEPFTVTAYPVDNSLLRAFNASGFHPSMIGDFDFNESSPFNVYDGGKPSGRTKETEDTLYFYFTREYNGTNPFKIVFERIDNSECKFPEYILTRDSNFFSSWEGQDKMNLDPVGSPPRTNVKTFQLYYEEEKNTEDYFEGTIFVPNKNGQMEIRMGYWDCDWDGFFDRRKIKITLYRIRKNPSDGAESPLLDGKTLDAEPGTDYDEPESVHDEPEAGYDKAVPGGMPEAEGSTPQDVDMEKQDGFGIAQYDNTTKNNGTAEQGGGEAETEGVVEQIISFFQSIFNFLVGHSECEPNEFYSDHFNMCIEKASCKSYIYNGNSNETVDILFLGDEYTNDEDIEEDLDKIVDVNGENNGLFSIEPYKSEKDRFNIQYLRVENALDSNETGEPDYHQARELFSECHDSDYQLIISKKNFRSFAFTFGTDAYNSLEYSSEEHWGRVVAHEFGHLFGRLADEYVEEGEPDDPRYPNCADDNQTAQTWWGDVEGAGYFSGCSYVEDNIRPTFNSIMRDHTILDDDYGPVNERHLRSELDEYG